MIGRSTMLVVVLSWVVVELDLASDLEVVIPLEIPAILRPHLLDLEFNPLACVTRLDCKIFLDHPQRKFWIYWRGSQPSPVRVSKKQKSKKKN
jgi:hypothetical protein